MADRVETRQGRRYTARKATKAALSPRDQPLQYEVAWKPQPGPQTAAIECPVQDLLYGGARGGGKTDFLLGDFAAHAARWGQYAKGILFRQSYVELEEVIARSKEIFTPLGCTYNETKHQWTFPTKAGERRGATLKLRYLRRSADAAKYQGHSYTWLGFDEAGNWPDSKGIDMLWATLRSAHVPNEHLVRRLSANPGGPGHVWVKQRYIEPSKKGYVPFTYRPQPEELPDLTITAVFIPAKLTDNPLLDPETYKRRLAAAAQGNPALLKAWLDGDWDVFVGQAFFEWRDAVHVTRNTIQHLRNWRWLAGLDWGSRKGCIVLAAQGPEGDVEVVAAIVFSKISARQAAYEIFAKRWRNFPTPELILADDQMWQDSGVKKGMTIASEFNAGLLEAFPPPDDTTEWNGPRLVKASKGQGSRKVKYDRMHRFLAWGAAHGHDMQAVEARALQPWERPLLRIQARCTYLTTTLPSLPVDPEKPEDDVDTDADDHGYDAVCNILLHLPEPPAEVGERKPFHQHPGMTKKGQRRRKWQDADDDAIDRVMATAGRGEQIPTAFRPGELVRDED